MRLSRRERRKLRLSGVKLEKEEPLAQGMQRPEQQPILPVSSSLKNKQEKQKKHKPIELPRKERVYKNWLIKLYDKEYKKLLIIPMLILVFSLGVIAYQTITTGSFIIKGISLTGGQTITITEAGINAEELQAYLQGQFVGKDISVRLLSEFGENKGVIIDTSLDVDQQTLIAKLKEKIPEVEGKYSIETIGSSLGAGFFEEILLALAVAFLFMSIVVFILFRTFVPSMAVIMSAFSDMVFTVAVIDLIGLKLSSAGVAALIMLIGYSVDTDILLTTRLLKAGRGDYLDRTLSSMKTGITMTLTAIAVSIIAIIFGQSEVIRQIFTILLIGLIADIFNTWIQNVGILWIYMEKKGLKH
ncbi:MAG: protein translocase subunit SecF [Nanoarchaeota archaeon]